MKSFTIQIPDNIDLTSADIKLRVAARLYEEAKVSLGEGAIIAEVSKRFFIENLASVGVSVFNYSTDELLVDIEHA